MENMILLRRAFVAGSLVAVITTVGCGGGSGNNENSPFSFRAKRSGSLKQASERAGLSFRTSSEFSSPLVVEVASQTSKLAGQLQFLVNGLLPVQTDLGLDTSPILVVGSLANFEEMPVEPGDLVSWRLSR